MFQFLLRDIEYPVIPNRVKRSRGICAINRCIADIRCEDPPAASHGECMIGSFAVLCVRKSVSDIPEQIGSIISIRGDGGKHRHRPNCES